jgi:hypothetical protein
MIDLLSKRNLVDIGLVSVAAKLFRTSLPNNDERSSLFQGPCQGEANCRIPCKLFKQNRLLAERFKASITAHVVHLMST